MTTPPPLWPVRRPPLVLPVPPSANHQYHPILRGARAYGMALTPAARAWKTEAALLARQWARRVAWDGSLPTWVVVGFRVTWPDRRAHDLPNLKALWDALEHILYPNDRWVLPYPFLPTVDRANPHVTLWVYQPDELPPALLAGPPAPA
ncbi:RusA family crossover junction endodeoxyribonuclease [Sulfobacillus sp. hq2]|uniref:RusA family crossover junction endodeoxyribonuclease n=1 Tax=Sulfobacillus sp. hq2 TaxID=2039167 RepID=UPI000CD117A8|nr:RusA family crossover junction endodeoxyribonuclease [Sulfobacillus sp. hq2]POB12203.1 hypothetical protein CO251_00825 [Sulfobacillus sp. hq2]